MRKVLILKRVIEKCRVPTFTIYNTDLQVNQVHFNLHNLEKKDWFWKNQIKN